MAHKEYAVYETLDAYKKRIDETIKELQDEIKNLKDRMGNVEYKVDDSDPIDE